MKQILLLRHGEADYAGPKRWNAPGWGGDLAPLSERGISQVKKSLKELENYSFNKIISSPTTRTLHTSAIIARARNLEVEVEFDLHEWVPFKDFSWKSERDVLSRLNALRENDGDCPDDVLPPWETLDEVRDRAFGAIEKHEGAFLVVCHEIVIWALTGESMTEFGAVRVVS